MTDYKNDLEKAKKQKEKIVETINQLSGELADISNEIKNLERVLRFKVQSEKNIKVQKDE